uniref:Uncharacterized protein n=1 Tax=Candidatus Kentrum sp. TC TaxID=2126339 RepID=A0A450ZU54_9GAMM|nr:MAG: hypothetical protein BECKTC1821F_GA0114240_101645 [Candidatus Kentron sp. TC]
MATATSDILERHFYVIPTSSFPYSMILNHDIYTIIVDLLIST